jgi:hypothetical protein
VDQSRDHAAAPRAGVHPSFLKDLPAELALHEVPDVLDADVVAGRSRS